jgi:hypothetical protein
VIGGRLKIINESRYDTAEVEELVRFGLSEIDLKGTKLLALVQNNRKHEYRGWAFEGWSDWHEHASRLAKKFKCDYVIIVLVGRPEQFPARVFKRNGIEHDYKTWQEAMVGISAHEGLHVQHYYDGVYPHWEKSGTRKVKLGYGKHGTPKIAIRRVRVGSERIEPKCAAWERYMLLKYRAKLNGEAAA